MSTARRFAVSVAVSRLGTERDSCVVVVTLVGEGGRHVRLDGLGDELGLPPREAVGRPGEGAGHRERGRLVEQPVPDDAGDGGERLLVRLGEQLVVGVDDGEAQRVPELARREQGHLGAAADVAAAQVERTPEQLLGVVLAHPPGSGSAPALARLGHGPIMPVRRPAGRTWTTSPAANVRTPSPVRTTRPPSSSTRDRGALDRATRGQVHPDVQPEGRAGGAVCRPHRGAVVAPVARCRPARPRPRAPGEVVEVGERGGPRGAPGRPRAPVTWPCPPAARSRVWSTLTPVPTTTA